MSQKIFGIDPQKRTTISSSKRNSGFQAEGVDFDELNQLLFELRADHIIGNATQLSNNECTVVFQSSDQTFRDSQGSLVTFINGEKIIWAGLDTITADIDLSTIDDLTHETLTGVTIALGSYDLLLGDNHRGELTLTGTGNLTGNTPDGLRVATSGGFSVELTGGDAIINNVIRANNVTFETEDLKIYIPTNSTIRATCKRMSLLDANYIPEFLDDFDETWDTALHLEAGTLEKPSTDYGMWIDKEKNLILAPDLLGTCTSTVSGFLVDSTATLLTDLVHVGDILYNLTTGLYTTASADSVAEDRVATTGDIFTLGDQYKIVKMSPVGLVNNRERIGSVFNNSGSNFEDSWYTQPQPVRTYDEDESGMFPNVGSWTTNSLSIDVFQVLDWTGRGEWRGMLNINADAVGSGDGFAVSTAGVSMKQSALTLLDSYIRSRGPDTQMMAFTGSGQVTLWASSSINWGSGTLQISGPIIFNNKPTFHH